MTHDKAINILHASEYQYPSNEYSKDEIYEAVDLAVDSIYIAKKHEKSIKQSYQNGKNFCKDALQGALIFSPFITITICLIISLFSKNKFNVSEYTVAVILQDAIMYIFYRILDIKDGEYNPYADED